MNYVIYLYFLYKAFYDLIKYHKKLYKGNINKKRNLNVRDIPGASAKENKIKICETEHNYMDVYRRNRDDDI